MIEGNLPPVSYRVRTRGNFRTNPGAMKLEEILNTLEDQSHDTHFQLNSISLSSS
jgi:hypothetical protein